MAQSELLIEGKSYVPSKVAAAETGYAQDYVGQLARGGHILAKRIGGLWYVELESVKNHKKESEAYVPEAPEGAVSAAGDTVVFDGVEYISSKQAAQATNYAQDYIGQLARTGKIRSRQVGGRWYVAKTDLARHKKEKDGLLAAVQAEAMGLKPVNSEQKRTEGSDVAVEEVNVDASLVSSIQPLRRLPKEQPLLTYFNSEGEALPKLAEKHPRFLQNSRDSSQISDYRHDEQEKIRAEGADEGSVTPIAIRAMHTDISRSKPSEQIHDEKVYGYSSQGAHVKNSAPLKLDAKRKNARGALAFIATLAVLSLISGSTYAIYAYAPNSMTAAAIENAYFAGYDLYGSIIDAITPGVEYKRR